MLFVHLLRYLDIILEPTGGQRERGLTYCKLFLLLFTLDAYFELNVEPHKIVQVKDCKLRSFQGPGN